MIYGGINMTAMIANSLGLNLNGGWLNERGVWVLHDLRKVEVNAMERRSDAEKKVQGLHNMNNSQFWTWVDYWECWDFMQDELEDELELEDWADEALWLICLKCGNPLEGCIC